ncbi:hypothetical protein QFC19_003632 [Naganishia cerealis]|uniref:Uncharacterized protein n=1 Tax=Naganishia cerealis TaxID=610337 RepID=A0ACC2W0N4_9TREE|nr:hypothetical protein QFC19_003632 [Naganishia cerealis]
MSLHWLIRPLPIWQDSDSMTPRDMAEALGPATELEARELLKVEDDEAAPEELELELDAAADEAEPDEEAAADEADPDAEAAADEAEPDEEAAATAAVGPAAAPP